MSHLNIIFAVWDDNAEALAADIGEKGVTVRQWRNRGDIPSRSAQLKIIRAAFDRRGKVLRLEDFLSAEERRALPGCGHGRADTGGECCASATNAAANIGEPGQAAASANNIGENIREHEGEADSLSPFSDPRKNGPADPSSGASPSISSTTSGPPNTPPANPASSTESTEASVTDPSDPSRAAAA